MNNDYNQEFTGISSEDDALIVVQNSPTIIGSIPDAYLTDNVLYEAMIRSDLVYEMVHPDQFTENLVSRLLLSNIRSLALLPSDKVKNSHLIELVRQNGLNIEALDEELLTTEICVEAIRSDPQAHQYVPFKFQTKAYIDELIVSRPDFVERIDVSLRDPDVVRGLIPKNPHLIRYLAMPDRTYDASLAAVAADPVMLQYVPEKVYDNKKFQEVVSEMGYFKSPKKVLPSGLIRSNFADFLFEKNPSIYQFLPNSIKTVEMAKKAVTLDSSNIFYTPEGLKKDGTVWESCLRFFPKLYPYIPPDQQSDKIRIFIAKQEALSSGKSFEQMFSGEKE